MKEKATIIYNRFMQKFEAETNTLKNKKILDQRQPTLSHGDLNGGNILIDI
jgi:thiamine kinase-like enzyme